MSDNNNKKYSIGIDLGTTYCCVCVYRNNKVDVITNDNGNRITPSYVSFMNGQRYVGESAKELMGTNSTNTIYDAKRLIGRKFNDLHVQNDLTNYSFKIVDKDNQIFIKVEENKEIKQFCPEEISSIILKKLKYDAEIFLNCCVTDAVITVPAYFTNSQRESTIQAGRIAGLNVLRIINEPTAAAIAYKLENNDHKEKNIMVYDLGGGTLDVTILIQSSDKMLECKAVEGDSHLGGEDFDHNICNYCLLEFTKKNFKNSLEKKELDYLSKTINLSVQEIYKLEFKKLKKLIKNCTDKKCIEYLNTILVTKEIIDDISNNPQLIGKLKKECEKAKKILSSNEFTSINIDNFYKKYPIHVELSREKFNELNSNEFKRCMLPVERILTQCPEFKNNIDKITDIVLIGGSTRIPKIRELLKEKFGNKIRSDINPDEAVAYGASIQAAKLSGVVDNTTGSIMLLDVIPLTLGIDTYGGITEPIIKKNTPIPVSFQKIFTTSQDNQSGVTVTICEGERSMTKDNNILGKFELTGIKPEKKGCPKITVEFIIDADGIISATATDNETKNFNKITIQNNTRLTEDDIVKMINDAEKYSEKDKLIKETIETEHKLKNYINRVKSIIEEPQFILTIGEKKQNKILLKLSEVIEIISDDSVEHTKELLQESFNKLQIYINPILDTYSESSNIENKTSTIIDDVHISLGKKKDKMVDLPNDKQKDKSSDKQKDKSSDKQKVKSSDKQKDKSSDKQKVKDKNKN